MNLLIATGNLGQDATQRFTPSGDSIVSFSLPVKSGYGEKAKTSWVRCTMFGKRGESVYPYLRKGTLVGVSGEFSMNDWEDKDGQKRSSPECRVNDITLLGGKSQSDTQQQEKPQRGAPQAQKTGFDDMDDPHIPF